ncbi:MAG: toll/interleukin-1 receptor domain-containing protein [Mycobacterium sp.]|nr:toll/interleukin-1 receptor domain-containing protein [Mycobacterium sp.]MBV9722450.1 toll/interleukin-1 receptor domain-containing protein [Mycobacterium sp.]
MTIFISHSSRDHATVRSLAQHLQTANESVWLDQSLIGGEAWWERILHQIRSCKVFVVALSNSCLQSKPCRAEMDYAKVLGLPILPVIIGDVDSYRIDPIFTVQSVDFRNPDAGSGTALIAAIRERAAERKELPDPLPDPPPVPYGYLQRLGVAIDSPEELSPTEQSTILSDLRQALRQEQDESVRDDIRRLLGALRRRSEVTHATVDEIDDLLRRYPSHGLDDSTPATSESTTSGTAGSLRSQADSSGYPAGHPASATANRASTKPRSPMNPKIVAIAVGVVVVAAVIGLVAYLMMGRSSRDVAANRSATATAAPQSGVAAPASASSTGQTISGHYIETDTGAISTTLDWYFTPCGDGCAMASHTPSGTTRFQVRLVNGQWRMETGPDQINCTDGTKVPSALSVVETWDPNTLAGTVQETYQVPACGHPAGTQETINIQLRRAP